MQDNINIIGKINLEDYMTVYQESHRKVPIFKLLKVTVSFFNQSPIEIDFGMTLNEPSHYFSLFIGMNGIGKSCLLRAVIDFFADVRNSKLRSFRLKEPVTVSSLEYMLGSNKYRIDKYTKIIKYKRNGRPVGIGNMEFSLVVASTMGMFDKFPINSIPGRDRNARYDSKFYKYVGPKASNNMFTSKTNVLLHILSSIGEIENEVQLRKIAEILKYIGYDTNITFRFKAKSGDAVNGKIAIKKNKLDADALSFFENLKDAEEHTIHIQFEHDGLSKVRTLRLRELDRLRQEGLLTSFRCVMYKKGEDVECNQMSSGEFNMLSIVLSVILSAGNQHLLVLLDEPEISQHPNWQVGIINKLDEALSDYGCHFLIATHCHFLVSNLPLKRSNLLTIEEQEKRKVIKSMPSETYGWSSEEVLLKVFGMATDRSMYLAEIVGKLMTKIGHNDIALDEVRQEINFLKQVSAYLSTADSMKKIIDTITHEFSRDE